MSQKIAIYPGTFDPITLGHIDIAERSSKIFDKVFVVIGVNSNKKSLFSEKERYQMVVDSLSHLLNIEVVTYNGLIVDIAEKLGANTIIRGLRAVSDFDYEYQIALMNRKICSNIDTIFMLPDEKYTYLSSSIVRELAQYNEDIHHFVSSNVAAELRKKFGKNIVEIV